MVSALIAPISKSTGSAPTLTKFTRHLDHANAMLVDSSIKFVAHFLAEVWTFPVYLGLVSQIWLTNPR